MHYLLLILTPLLFLISGCSKAPEPLQHKEICQSDIYAMRSAECIDMERLLEKIEPYQIIFVGDHHDSSESHAFTAGLIGELDQKGYRIHLANEWFSPEDNALLSEYADKKFNDGNFTKKIAWKKKAGYDFELFAPIYHAVQEADGELYGINLSKAFQKRISDQNISGMSESEKVFYDTLDLNVSAHQQMLSPFFSHCHRLKKVETQEACQGRMNRVQVAWDTMMARESAVLADTVLKTKKDKLIVFAGSMHLAYSLGVNLRFGRYSDLPYVTILPEVRSDSGMEHGLADYLFLYSSKQPDE
ncbi:MAG: ChaN family lipoprotein [Campylobacterota bacterium]|nr:ChaN family lipoprotein [Campylobacterota bacterium]